MRARAHDAGTILSKSSVICFKKARAQAYYGYTIPSLRAIRDGGTHISVTFTRRRAIRGY